MTRLIASCLFSLCFLLFGATTCAMDTPPNKPDICFNDEAKAELHQLCTEIIRQFPPEEYFYIGIGRSPTRSFCGFSHRVVMMLPYRFL